MTDEKYRLTLALLLVVHRRRRTHEFTSILRLCVSCLLTVSSNDAVTLKSRLFVERQQLFEKLVFSTENQAFLVR